MGPPFESLKALQVNLTQMSKQWCSLGLSQGACIKFARMETKKINKTRQRFYILPGCCTAASLFCSRCNDFLSTVTGSAILREGKSTSLEFKSILTRFLKQALISETDFRLRWETFSSDILGHSGKMVDSVCSDGPTEGEMLIGAFEVLGWEAITVGARIVPVNCSVFLALHLWRLALFRDLKWYLMASFNSCRTQE